MSHYEDGYGAELGIQITCQRCGKQIFRRKTSVDKFELMPKGWKINRKFYHYGWWCPDCVKNYTI